MIMSILLSDVLMCSISVQGLLPRKLHVSCIVKGFEPRNHFDIIMLCLCTGLRYIRHIFMSAHLSVQFDLHCSVVKFDVTHRSLPESIPYGYYYYL